MSSILFIENSYAENTTITGPDLNLVNYNSSLSTPETNADLPEVSLSSSSVQKSFGIRIDTVETSLFTAAGHPFGSLTADINLGSGLAIGPLFAWGPSQPIDHAEMGIWSLGVHAVIYFSGKALQDGWFLRGYYSHFTAWASMSTMASNIPVQATGSIGFDALGGTLGYEWIWQSGFSLSLGLGAEHFITNVPSVSLSSTDPNTGALVSTEVALPSFAGQGITLPMPEITLGWAF